ncbi:MAG: hypothetical protein EOS73_28695 [Mesorhizobium sp.]|uniref:hypothetical protein n=1 Tax=Mesorhizobium sp. M7A.F.Ca.ET.027.02.1.1 TaxID=2496655 RepID=UPI000FD21483|nr:hypothetical protein [Mesorhizobium sp. M7A.F.Ca.ET.027.02.1.1]RVD15411.1 hypothetical protein EN749_16035 [Mesorhizobium sp. M7A.F.Ca.ET.027.02.1.1]RWC99180.1 MAG: hypothetical protein EOS73_28695 [Mesorhizobium sp.]
MEGDTKTCPDCAETVQREARICRFCRHDFGSAAAAPPAKEKRPLSKWFILPALAVLVWVGLHKGEKLAAPAQVVSTGICDSFNAQGAIDAAVDIGIVRGTRRDGTAVHIEVNTARWVHAERKFQVSIAMAAYCQVAAQDGTGVAIVKGSLDEDLGSVVNGNWMR